MSEPKPPPSTPDGDQALRRAKATAYRMKRELAICRHGNCKEEDGLVVVVTERGYSVRCERHCEGMERLPGQWIDSPLHQQLSDHRA